MWGLDIMGPFPPGRGNLKFLLVAVDYMTKWVKAKAVSRITTPVCKAFFHEFVVTHFGIPRILITDNGKQFIDTAFEEYLATYLIQHRRSSVAHPQSNGQVEVTNRSLLQNLRKNLEDVKTNWVDELPNILWAYRTDPRKPTGESAFRLTFGTEALVPVEVGEESLRVKNYDPLSNEEGIRANLDLLSERRDSAVIRMANYQQKTTKYFGSVRPREFQVGDRVLRSTLASDPTHTKKLDPTWEGPYLISQAWKPGTYILSRMDGSIIANTWHATHLRMYYP